MSVETSAVQISVNVIDNTSNQVLAGVEQNLNKLGTAGLRSGAQVEEGMKRAGAGMLSATEKTRLAAEEMGVRLPRAMISLIGQSEAAQAVLSSLSTALIGFGAIQIGGMVFAAAIEGAEKLWNNYLSLNHAADEYEKTLKKQKDEDYWNSHDIETTTLRINEAKNAAESFRGVADAIHRSGWADIFSGNVGMGLGELYNAHQLAGEAVKNRERADKLSPEQERQNHEDALAHIELAHAGDARLRGEQKITAEKRKQHAINVEDASFKYSLDSNKDNPVAADAAEKEQNTKNSIADAKANAELFNLRRAQNQELAHLREQALEAGLRGTALYKAQEAAAIEELKFKDMDSVAARNAIKFRFHAEEMKRLQEQEHAIEKMRESTQLAGLTGTARIHQEERNRISEVYNPDNGLTPGQRLAEGNEIHKQTVQEISALNKSFAERVDEIVGSSASRELQGFARISADAQNEIRKLRAEAAKNGGKPEDLTRGIDAIKASEAGQIKDRDDKNRLEDERLEAQARVKFLSAEKQKTAAIQTELNERKEKYAEELKAREITQEDYNRRVLAAEQEANAERIQAAEEARKKMAGEFTSFFKGMEHPQKYLAELGDKAAGQAAASLWQRFSSSHGGAAAEGPGGIFGDMMSGFGLGKKKAPGAGAVPGMPATHEAGKSMSIATAMIHIGSASISGGGFAGGSTSVGNATVAGPGSTTLLAPGAGGSFGGGASTPAGAAFSSSRSTADMAANIGSGIAAPGGGVGPSNIAQAKGALTDVSQGFGLYKQLSKDFSGSGAASQSAAGGSMASGGFSASNVTGAAQGALGVFSASQGGGGVGGALKGAMSGAEAGMAIAGPIGALIGAGVGAVLGGLGSGKAAREYDLKTVRPRMAQDLEAYHSGGMNYLAAYSDAQSLEMDADRTTKKMGPADYRYFSNTIKPELTQFMAKLTAQEKAGRSQYSSSTAQYASGTDYVPGTGLAILHKGEGVFDSGRNERVTQAVESMSKMPVQSASMGDVHLHVHAIDARGVSQFLDKYKHNIRSAVNDSYAENSGGGLN
jgi:hypothetical protein